jgi:hypothetical protein
VEFWQSIPHYFVLPPEAILGDETLADLRFRTKHLRHLDVLILKTVAAMDTRVATDPLRDRVLALLRLDNGGIAGQYRIALFSAIEGVGGRTMMDWTAPAIGVWEHARSLYYGFQRGSEDARKEIVKLVGNTPFHLKPYYDDGGT